MAHSRSKDLYWNFPVPCNSQGDISIKLLAIELASKKHGDFFLVAVSLKWGEMEVRSRENPSPKQVCSPSTYIH